MPIIVKKGSTMSQGKRHAALLFLQVVTSKGMVTAIVIVATIIQLTGRVLDVLWFSMQLEGYSRKAKCQKIKMLSEILPMKDVGPVAASAFRMEIILFEAITNPTIPHAFFKMFLC